MGFIYFYLVYVLWLRTFLSLIHIEINTSLFFIIILAIKQLCTEAFRQNYIPKIFLKTGFPYLAAFRCTVQAISSQYCISRSPDGAVIHCGRMKFISMVLNRFFSSASNWQWETEVLLYKHIKKNTILG